MEANSCPLFIRPLTSRALRANQCVRVARCECAVYCRFQCSRNSKKCEWLTSLNSFYGHWPPTKSPQVNGNNPQSSVALVQRCVHWDVCDREVLFLKKVARPADCPKQFALFIAASPDRCACFHK